MTKKKRADRNKRPPSAKPLFRAMKAKKSADDGFFGALPEQRPPQPPEMRREGDFYATGEPEALAGLLALDGDKIRRLGGVIWEPAVGAGHLAVDMVRAGFAVRGGDIALRGCPGIICLGSYYATTVAAAPAIITNPPFAEINARDGHGRWLRHTLEMPGWRYLALLLSWEWPAAVINGHAALLDQHPFSYCYLMRWKLDFTGRGEPAGSEMRGSSGIATTREPRTARRLPEPSFRWMDKPRADVAQISADF